MTTSPAIMLAATDHYKSIAELHSALTSGTVTAKVVVEKYLETIKELDPTLNAFTAVSEQAIEDATKIDVGNSSTFRGL